MCVLCAPAADVCVCVCVSERVLQLPPDGGAFPARRQVCVCVCVCVSRRQVCVCVCVCVCPEGRCVDTVIQVAPGAGGNRAGKDVKLFPHCLEDPASVRKSRCLGFILKSSSLEERKESSRLIHKKRPLQIL